MKRIIKIILIILVITSGINLLIGNVVQAESDSRRLLVEIWDEKSGKYLPLEGKPIFNVSNFLPGDVKTEKIRVTNCTNETQTVASKVIHLDKGCNISKEYCLADKLILTITPLNNLSPSYSGSLTEFYNAGEVVLSEIESRGEAEYNFSVYFDKDAEKEYQSLTTSFDVEIGFLSKETISKELYWGEKRYTIPLSEGVGKITLTGPPIVTFNSAIINWTTDIPSLCRVVYDEVSHPVLGDLPNYGYAFSTNPTDVKKNSHQIQLSGLKSDTTYFFRIICWASPKKISQEYSFKTKALTTITSQTSQISQNEEEIGGKMTEKGLIGETKENETQEKTQKEEEEKEEEKEKDKGSEKSKGSFRARGLLAAIRNLPLDLKIILLALLIIIIILIIVWAKREKKEKQKYK